MANGAIKISGLRACTAPKDADLLVISGGNNGSNSYKLAIGSLPGSVVVANAPACATCQITGIGSATDNAGLVVANGTFLYIATGGSWKRVALTDGW